MSWNKTRRYKRGKVVLSESHFSACPNCGAVMIFSVKEDLSGKELVCSAQCLEIQILEEIENNVA
jgi:transposase